MEQEEVVDTEKVSEEVSGVSCPECGSDHVSVSGHCFTCYECGFSLCSL